jgi:ribosome-associated protein
MDIRTKQRAVVEALEDVKGRDILVFNVAKQTAYFERVVIASGDSNRQVNALAASVHEKLKALGARVNGIEGRRNGEWVLVDLGDIVVHVMHPAVRAHYNLEELWGGKEVKLKSESPKTAARTAAGRAAAKKSKKKPAARKSAARARPRGKAARPRRRA